MAFANFSITTVYATLISMLNTQLTAVGKLFKDQATGDFTDQIRYNSAGKRLEYWNGSAWAALDVSLSAIAAAAIASGTVTANLTGNVTGNVTGSSGSCTGNANTASSCSGNANSANSATTAANATGTGTIPYARYEGGLRIIRGRIGNTGSILYGAGFTVSHSLGNYTINFTDAFSSTPMIMITPSEAGTNPWDYYISSWSTYCNVSTYYIAPTTAAKTLTNFGFDFIAIGPN